MTPRKKLIEVGLPLDAINRESAREKSIRHGHPSTLHLWWSRKPLAACRAVLFAQLVDDPSSVPEEFPDEAAQARERERLHGLIAQLVKWENSTNEAVLERARFEIARSLARGLGIDPPPKDDPEAVLAFLAEHAPPVFDPFCGGGSIPLEAQRLGLRAIASDINPVAVLITKALVEFPPRFRGLPPVNPESRGKLALAGAWQGRGAQGLAEDVRYYGRWMREEAERRIGHLYPKVRITPEMAKRRPDLKPYVGRELTVIAWLWARTVRSPNPAAKGAMVPLVASFMLSTKAGKEAWVEIVKDPGAPDGWHFEVRTQAVHGAPPKEAKEGTVDRKGARCALTGVPIPFEYIRAEGQAGHMGRRLLAIVAEGKRQRLYLDPLDQHVEVAERARPDWRPDVEFDPDALGFRIGGYGLRTWGDLFTDRQLVALNTFAAFVGEARERVLQDARAAGMPDDGVPLAEGGRAATAYADAVAVYLAFAVSRAADFWNSNATWQNDGEFIAHLFTRQAIPMMWDFSEGNPFSSVSGNWDNTALSWIPRCIEILPAGECAEVWQRDAADPVALSCLVSTDPPYYDNVGYADLSDFFYIWLRRVLKDRFPDLFATLQVPKQGELVATPHRHGGKEEAEEFFLEGMGRALRNLADACRDDIPAAIYYAFRQKEIESDGITSTGWATFLEAVLAAGFQIDGTWPIRTERGSRMRSHDSNALANSIVLVCRRRPADAPVVSRREFLRALERELPEAVRTLQRSGISPVDLWQAAIGPGMAVFSRYADVREADDSRMDVRTALALINERLDAILAEQDADYDPWTRFALSWYEAYGFDPGPYGEAETMAKARNVSVEGVAEAGILEAKGGKVRLLRREELPEDWNPQGDPRATVWEALWQLVNRLGRGENEAVLLLRDLGPLADSALELAYRLFQIAERKGWSEDARSVNALARVFPELRVRASAGGAVQGELLEEKTS